MGAALFGGRCVRPLPGWSALDKWCRSQAGWKNPPPVSGLCVGHGLQKVVIALRDLQARLSLGAGPSPVGAGGRSAPENPLSMREWGMHRPGADYRP